MFGNQLDEKDSILQSLLAGASNECDEALQLVASAIETVLLRQLKDLMATEPSKELLDKTKSAPVHNMASEQIIGMCDYQINRSPNACMESMEAKVKFQKNKTDNFFKSNERSSDMIRYSVGRARRLFVQQKERRATNTAICRQRQDQNQIKRVEQALKSLSGGTATKVAWHGAWSADRGCWTCGINAK